MLPRSRRIEDLLKGVVDEPTSVRSTKKPDSIWWTALGRNKKAIILPVVFLGMTFAVLTMQLTAPKSTKHDAATAISDSVCPGLMTKIIDRKYKNITPEQKVQLLQTELRLRGR
ncbi:hypothetical protein V1525DRAFT_385148 [Lipomyces kononenkoae]|uniref:Uncharacterized protein n=1 Tax=Lipomyces kononenkoae TaxID=34357 RepID=A0ACC3TB47_LIPKO